MAQQLDECGRRGRTQVPATGVVPFLPARQFGTVIWSQMIRFFRLPVHLMVRVCAHLSALNCVIMRVYAPFTAEF